MKEKLMHIDRRIIFVFVFLFSFNQLNQFLQLIFKLANDFPMVQYVFSSHNI